MKHHHLRKDKNCLNCGATVEDRFCSHCGQENTEPRESFSHLIGHFTADITHYDAQIITTVKDLILRPGFLTKEYNAGKRVSYLNPIRMFIFISAIFFLVSFSDNKEDEPKAEPAIPKKEVNIFRQHLADSLRGEIKTGKSISQKDSIHNSAYASVISKLDTPKIAKKLLEESINTSFNSHGQLIFDIQQDKYRSLKEYDSAQQKLPDTAKDGFFSKMIIKKCLRLGAGPRHGGELIIKRDIDHDLERIAFLLLPVFALLVRFFYSRKKYWYSQHVIFSLHFHSFMFLVLLVFTLINFTNPDGKVLLYLAGACLLGLFIYLAAALHRVYEQKLWLSAIKAGAISILYITSLILALIALMVIYFIVI